MVMHTCQKKVLQQNNKKLPGARSLKYIFKLKLIFAVFHSNNRMLQETLETEYKRLM